MATIVCIKIWLSNRLFYVDSDGHCSYITTSESSTIQGSRLAPYLYAIYVTPLFDLHKTTNYANENLTVHWNSCLKELINDMKKNLEAIKKWLKDSGLKVNESKMDLCIFLHNPHKSIKLL